MPRLPKFKFKTPEKQLEDEKKEVKKTWSTLNKFNSETKKVLNNPGLERYGRGAVDAFNEILGIVEEETRRDASSGKPRDVQKTRLSTSRPQIPDNKTRRVDVRVPKSFDEERRSPSMATDIKEKKTVISDERSYVPETPQVAEEKKVDIYELFSELARNHELADYGGMDDFEKATKSIVEIKDVLGSIKKDDENLLFYGIPFNELKSRPEAFAISSKAENMLKSFEPNQHYLDIMDEFDNQKKQIFQIKQLKAEVEKSPLMQKLREESKTNGSKFSKVAREALEARITKSEVIDVGQHMKEINKDTMQR